MEVVLLLVSFWIIAIVAFVFINSKGKDDD